MEVYTIVRIGWEYNDEHHYRSEGGAGDPIRVYKDREKAEAECLRQNIESYLAVANSRWANLASYLGDPYDLEMEPDTIKRLEKLGVTMNTVDCDVTVPTGLSDDVMAEIMRHLGVVFYEIEPLEYVE